MQLQRASGVVRLAPDPPSSVDPPTAATQSPGLRPTPLSIAGVAGEVSRQQVASCFPVASHCWLGAAGLPWMLPSRERDVQWAGQGPFRLVLQALFVAAHEDDPRNDEEHGQHEEHNADLPVNVVTEEVPSQAVERGPDDGSGGIEEQEARPAHAVEPVYRAHRRCIGPPSVAYTIPLFIC
jgi:hypothetical protein